jgi:uncharacterized membrane protein YfcA
VIVGGQATLALGVLAFITSFMTGMVGAGGTVLFIPAALYVLPLVGAPADVHLVTTLSLVQGLSAVLAGGYFHVRRGHLEYQHLWGSGLALGGGALAGGLLSVWTPSWLLMLMFALVASAAAVVLPIDPASLRFRAPAGAGPLAFAMFVCIGGLGGAAGLGVGVLIIPVLFYVLGADARNATGTGLVLPAFTTLPALIGKTVTGQLQWDMVPAVAVFGLTGGAVGAAITVALSPVTLRYGLAALTAALAAASWFQLLLVFGKTDTHGWS